MRSFAKPKSISLAPVLVSITFARKRTFLEPGRERLVAEPRHAEVVRAVGVADVVDLTHGASAKRCQHFVGTEGTADWDGHRLGTCADSKGRGVRQVRAAWVRQPAPF